MFKIVLITKNFVILLKDSLLLIRRFKKFIFIKTKAIKYKTTSNDLSGFIDKIEETKKSVRVIKKKIFVCFSLYTKLNLNLCRSKKNNENNPTRRVTPK